MAQKVVGSNVPGELDLPRPLRADAARNRQRLLDAAEELFAEAGVGVQVDSVAERAGVGVGTLYRHFPTKEALFEAILRGRLEQLAERAMSFATSDDPGQAFFLFLRDFAHHALDKRDLYEALGDAGVDVKARCASQMDEMFHAIARIIERAQSAGTVRLDVDVDDLIGLVAGTCHAAMMFDNDGSHFERLIELIADGFRPRD